MCQRHGRAANADGNSDHAGAKIDQQRDTFCEVITHVGIIFLFVYFVNIVFTQLSLPRGGGGIIFITNLSVLILILVCFAKVCSSSLFPDKLL